MQSRYLNHYSISHVLAFSSSGILIKQSAIVSSFIARSIDSVHSNFMTPDLSINDRFPSTMTLEQLEKLSTSCRSVWSAISKLLQQSDTLASSFLVSKSKALDPSQLVLVLHSIGLHITGSNFSLGRS